MTIQKAIDILGEALRDGSGGRMSIRQKCDADQALGFLTGIFHGLALMHPEITPLREFAYERSCREKE